MKTNKKGAIPFSGFAGLVFWAMVAIVVLPFLFGGGFLTSFKIGLFITKIPVWIWVILIVVFIFGGKKK